MSAGEFVDGLKFSSLKRALAHRMREAAFELWGFPGSFIAVKLMNGGLSQRREGAKNSGTDGSGEGAKGRRGDKRSRYFLTRPEELFEECRSDERARRIGELCAMLRADFDLESWAISAGYASGAKLRRACLNVCGRTLAQIERALASEVVQFYLCAEDRELRAMACSDVLSVEVARARELYHGDDAKPEPPFVDEWSKFEELKAEWLSKLRDWLT